MNNISPVAHPTTHNTTAPDDIRYQMKSLGAPSDVLRDVYDSFDPNNHVTLYASAWSRRMAEGYLYMHHPEMQQLIDERTAKASERYGQRVAECRGAHELAFKNIMSMNGGKA